MAISVLPVDMLAVAEYGVDRWCRDATWPVHYAEIRALSLAAINAFDIAASEVDEAWADCICSDVRYCYSLVQRIHAIAVAARVSAAGLTIDARGDGIGLYRPDYGEAAAVFRTQTRPSQRLGTDLRDARRRWPGNRHLPPVSRVGAVAMRPATWNIGAGNVLKEAYLSHRTIPCDFPNPADWSQPHAPIEVPASVRHALEKALLEIVSSFAGVHLNSLDHRGLIELWCVRLVQIRTVYDAATTRSSIPEVVLWGSSGNAMFRAVIHALRRRTVRIVGFQHGHNPVWVRHPHMVSDEVHGCDEFVCGTPGQADAYRRYDPEKCCFCNTRDDGLIGQH